MLTSWITVRLIRQFAIFKITRQSASALCPCLTLGDEMRLCLSQLHEALRSEVLVQQTWVLHEVVQQLLHPPPATTSHDQLLHMSRS